MQHVTCLLYRRRFHKDTAASQERALRSIDAAEGCGQPTRDEGLREGGIRWVST